MWQLPGEGGRFCAEVRMRCDLTQRRVQCAGLRMWQTAPLQRPCLAAAPDSPDTHRATVQMRREIDRWKKREREGGRERAYICQMSSCRVRGNSITVSITRRATATTSEPWQLVMTAHPYASSLNGRPACPACLAPSPVSPPNTTQPPANGGSGFANL